MRILIVDNDPDTVEATKAIITAMTPYQVDVAYSGKTGLEKMQAEPAYDLLILDIMMPEMSGIDVCKMMMADEKLKKIPILLASALPVGSPEFKASLTEFAELQLVTAVLEKPFAAEDLIAKMNAILGRKKTP